MIISDSRIAMASEYHYREQLQVRERLTVQTGAANTVTELQSEMTTAQTFETRVSLERPQETDFNTPMDAENRFKLLLIQRLFHAMTGKRFTLMSPDLWPVPLNTTAINLDANPRPLPQAAGGVGVIYERTSRYQENESVSFAALGKVRTADGREIDISAALHMSREYIEQTSVTLSAGGVVMTDPLVINFDGKGAGLSSTRFDFDLDSDGQPEQVASLAPGSGYLALDRNGDGEITQGTELFGPTTGNGFSELAQFDEDGNGFIDEADSIYSQLRIWQRQDDGTSQLMALGDKGIGAIYLGHISTPMQLTGPGNETLGEVVSSGIYLKENGETGIVQQINLAV